MSEECPMCGAAFGSASELNEHIDTCLDSTDQPDSKRPKLCHDAEQTVAEGAEKDESEDESEGEGEDESEDEESSYESGAVVELTDESSERDIRDERTMKMDDERDAEDTTVPYVCKTPAEMRKEVISGVDQFSSLCGVSKNLAYAILKTQGFKVERTVEAFFQDPAQLFAATGMQDEAACPPLPLWVGGYTAGDGADGAMCCICVTFQAANRLGSPEGGCEHRVCVSCWVEFFKNNSVDDPPCPHLECASPVGDVIIGAASAQALDEWHPVIVRNLLHESERLKWCPLPTCNNVIEVDASLLTENAPVVSVKCKCGFHYCSKCAETAHVPVPCAILKKWQAVLEEHKDQVAAEEQQVNTRAQQCPMCGVNRGYGQTPAEYHTKGSLLRTCSNGHTFCILCIKTVKEGFTHLCGAYDHATDTTMEFVLATETQVVMNDRYQQLNALVVASNQMINMRPAPANRTPAQLQADAQRRAAMPLAELKKEEDEAALYEELRGLQADLTAYMQTYQQDMAQLQQAAPQNNLYQKQNDVQQRKAQAEQVVQQLKTSLRQIEAKERGAAYIDAKLDLPDKDEAQVKLEAAQAKLDAIAEEQTEVNRQQFIINSVNQRYQPRWNNQWQRQQTETTRINALDITNLVLEVKQQLAQTVKVDREFLRDQLSEVDKVLWFQRAVHVHKRAREAERVQSTILVDMLAGLYDFDRRNLERNPVYLCHKAAEVLIEARSVLQHTFICGYYLPASVEPGLFFFQQSQLSDSLEALSISIAAVLPLCASMKPEDARVTTMVSNTSRVAQGSSAVQQILQGMSAENVAAKSFVTFEVIVDNGLQCADMNTPEGLAVKVLACVPTEVRLVIVHQAALALQSETDTAEEFNPTDEFIGIYQRRIHLVMKASERVAYNRRGLKCVAILAIESAFNVDLDEVDKTSEQGENLLKHLAQVHGVLSHAFTVGCLREYVDPASRWELVSTIAAQLRQDKGASVPVLKPLPVHKKTGSVPVFTILWDVWASAEARDAERKLKLSK